MKPLTRCPWPDKDPVMIAYHDTEWGVPVRNDRELFEHISLDGAQAGLSWRTILHKRPAYRIAFKNFEPQIVARFTKRDVARLLANPGIVRNRLKIQSTITNARAFLDLVEREGPFHKWLWQFVDGKPINNKIRTLKDIRATSPQSDEMSKALKANGFKFVGSTICYAFMQAAGLVNDHLVICHRHAEVQRPHRK